jgi:hypothetical protein
VDFGRVPVYQHGRHPTRGGNGLRVGSDLHDVLDRQTWSVLANVTTMWGVKALAVPLLQELQERLEAAAAQLADLAAVEERCSALGRQLQSAAEDSEQLKVCSHPVS